MKKGNKHFQNYFLIYFLVISTVIVGSISFYRFMVKGDYIVGYEGECSPGAGSCFTGCEDDACTQTYYYTLMKKYAPDLYRECGADITDCDDASICLPDDRDCSVTYCDDNASNDTCFDPTIEPSMPNDAAGSAGDNSLQDNDLNDTNI
jgi:hypothetical protein